MSKQEVIKALCALCGEVGGEVFNNDIPYDCFCEGFGKNFKFDKKIIEFIQSAVAHKITLVKIIKEK